MNPRERTIAIAVLVFVTVLGGAFLFYQLYLGPLHAKEERLSNVQSAVKLQNERINKVVEQKPKVLESRKLSLPSDPAFSQRGYEILLNQLLRDSGIAPKTFMVTPAATVDTWRGPRLDIKKSAFLTPVGFSVTGRTDLAHLVRLLERFYRTPVLHRIKSLVVKRPTALAGQAAKPGEGTRPGELDVNLTVEAAIVNGAENRSTLLPLPELRLLELESLTTLLGGPAGLATAGWAAGPNGPGMPHYLVDPSREYAAIVAKNIFYGLPPSPQQPHEGPDIAKSVQLAIISRPAGEDAGGCEAMLYNHADKTMTFLCPKKGKYIFQYKNDQGELRVEGTVVRINAQDLVFRAEGKLYSIRVGQTLEDALRTPLSDREVEALKLTQRTSVNGGGQ